MRQEVAQSWLNNKCKTDKEKQRQIDGGGTDWRRQEGRAQIGKQVADENQEFLPSLLVFLFTLCLQLFH